MTLLIKNARVIDGVHDFPEKADVFVAHDTISAIGDLSAKTADVTVDAQGAWLAPGFIDVNTGSDHYLTLLAYPSQVDFLKQGVTTIFGGMCGSSLAPLLYGSLEAIEKWGSAAQINVSWHTMAEFLATLEKMKLGVNFGTFAGHATIRRAIAGDETRELTKNEKNVFEKILRRALDEGAFGVSTGLGYVHGRGTSSAELAWLVDIAAKAGGAYATHLRDGADGVVASVKETIDLALRTGVRTLINHFVPFTGTSAEYEKALAFIDALPMDKNFRFDLYATAETMLPLHSFLPAWAQSDAATMAKSVADEWLAPRIIKDMTPIAADQWTVARAPGHEFLIGKSLTEIMTMYGTKDAREAFIKLCAATGVRGTALYRNLDENLLREGMKRPRSFIASNAPGFGAMPPGNMFRSERTTSTFTKFLSLAEKEELLPLRDAVRKISYEPAQFFGLKNRGEIREGAIADLAGFKDGEIKFTIVGGRVAVKDGEYQEGVNNGKVLRKK